MSGQRWSPPDFESPGGLLLFPFMEKAKAVFDLYGRIRSFLRAIGNAKLTVLKVHYCRWNMGRFCGMECEKVCFHMLGLG
jgi:hypothetical protein